MKRISLPPRYGCEIFVSTAGLVCIRQENPWSPDSACVAFDPDETERLIEELEAARQEALDTVPEEESDLVGDAP